MDEFAQFRVSDGGRVAGNVPRQRLAPLAPRLAATASRELGVTIAIMDTCVQVAADVGAMRAEPVRSVAHHRQHPTGGRPRRWVLEFAEVVYRRGWAHHQFRRIADRINTLPRGERDAALIALLEETTATAAQATNHVAMVATPTRRARAQSCAEV